MKKSKIFIALLMSLCIGVSSTGLLACGGGSDKDPDHSTTQPPDLDGENKEDDGTVLVKGFNIKAVDNNNNPVANVYFNVGLYNSSESSDYYLTGTGGISSDRSKAALLKTNSNGVAKLEVEVDSGKTYKLYLADPTYISSGGTISPIPKGYSSNLSATEFTEVEDGKYTITADFELDNSWGAQFDPGNNLLYFRYYPDYYKDELKIEYNPYVKAAVTNQHNYFSFAPYRAPMPDSTETSDKDDPATKELVAAVQAKGREAASGKYRISWTADDPTADVLLNLYTFVGGNYFQRNDDGSPTETYVKMHTGSAPTDEATLKAAYESYASFYGSEADNYETWLTSYLNSFSGTNYITLELSTDTSTTVYDFGFIANKNCKVTISVERIGNAAVWTSTEHKVPMPDNQPKAETEEGSVINPPLSASTVVVKGDDGYYHLGSNDGKIIYVQLKKPTRANTDFSMEFLSDPKNTDDRPQFVIVEDVFDEASNSGRHIYHNYADVVSGYAALANSDGLYPVNDLLVTVLKQFCASMMNYKQYGENYWLAACQFYGEIPDGTENKPYILETGNNSVPLSDGSAWVAFTPTVSGYYEFNYNVPGSILAKGKYYLYLEAQDGFKFKVEGAGSTYSLTIAKISDSQHLRYYGSDADDKQIWHGTEEEPLKVSDLRVCAVTIDHAAYNRPITVSIQLNTLLPDGKYIIRVASSNGDYSIKVKAENGYIDYDGEALSLSSSVATLIHLDSEQNGTFFIWLERAA